MESSLLIDLRPELNVPLHRQIYAQIRESILTGRVRSHSKLPASRQLAQTLGVSRTTVMQSYDQLISEGYLETRPGAGTFICAQIPDTLLQTDSPTSTSTDGPKTQQQTTGGPRYLPHHPLSDYGESIRQAPTYDHLPDGLLSFRYGVPDFTLLPIQPWRRLMNHHIQASTDWMNYSADAMGYRPLRTEIARYISQTRAVRCRPEQILVTTGTQQALALITRLLVNPGEAIAFEHPGYLSGQRVLSSHRAILLPVAVDREGLMMEGPRGLKAVAQAYQQQSPSHCPPKLVYLTPSHQFPTGVLMPLSRRLALLQWAQQQNTLLVEDDYDSEFRYSGRPIPALQGLDTASRVIYVGTFSKVMFPGLQLGYVVLPEALVPAFRQAKWLSDRQSSLIHQYALTDFIAEGFLAQHVRRMRTVYAQRRQTLVSALTNVSGQIEGNIEICGDEAGLHIMAKLPVQGHEEQLLEQARQKGVSLFSIQKHLWANAWTNPDHQATHHHLEDKHLIDGRINGRFIFGFGAINEHHIQQAIHRITPLLLRLSQGPKLLS